MDENDKPATAEEHLAVLKAMPEAYPGQTAKNAKYLASLLEAGITREELMETIDHAQKHQLDTRAELDKLLARHKSK